MKKEQGQEKTDRKEDIRRSREDRRRIREDGRRPDGTGAPRSVSRRTRYGYSSITSRICASTPWRPAKHESDVSMVSMT